MLVNMNEVLKAAQKGKYAVGLFNAVNMELARGIFTAAEETKSPIIVGTAEVLFPFGPLEEVSYYLKQLNLVKLLTLLLTYIKLVKLKIKLV